MQKLTGTRRNPLTGAEEVFTMKVIRSWTSAGQTIYLTAEGTYVYKNGDLVKTRGELSAVIVALNHLRQAEAWWDSVGKDLSEKYYAERERALERLAAKPEAKTLSDSELDAAMYHVRPAGADAWSPAMPWPGLFGTRPGWWGYARNVAFADKEFALAGTLESAAPVPAGPSAQPAPEGAVTDEF
ncbi:MAG: hypothetical protein AB1921_14575 [Thermodesulfobacteriota bacterium]